MLSKFIISVVLSISFAANAASDCQLKMRTTHFKPQFYQDANNQWQGMSVELAKAIVEEADCSVSYQPLTWKRALRQLKYGGLDMMLNVSATKEREKFLHFIGPLRDETMIIVTSKSLADVTSFEDIKRLPKNVGVLRGAFYGEKFAKEIRYNSDFAAKFEVADSTSINIEKLKNGRISGFLNDKYNAVHIIQKRLSKADYRIQPLIINTDDIFIGLSKKSVNLALKKRLQQALDRAVEKGTISAILNKYQPH